MVDKSSREKKLYAVKQILTRTVEGEKAVLEEVKFHRLINHPNLINLALLFFIVLLSNWFGF